MEEAQDANQILQQCKYHGIGHVRVYATDSASPEDCGKLLSTSRRYPRRGQSRFLSPSPLRQNHVRQGESTVCRPYLRRLRIVLITEGEAILIALQRRRLLCLSCSHLPLPRRQSNKFSQRSLGL
jgi:hypothetical protein